MYELISRIFKARDMIQEECRRPAKAEEIAQLVGISVNKLTATLECLKKPKLMSAKVYKNSEETVGVSSLCKSQTIGIIGNLWISEQIWLLSGAVE